MRRMHQDISGLDGGTASQTWFGHVPWWAAVILAIGCGTRVPHSDRPWCQSRVVVRNGADPVTRAEAILIADESSGGVDTGGSLDAMGTVEIPVLPGNYTVVVRPLPPAQEGTDRDAAARTAKSVVAVIPRRFHKATTSPYKVEVIKGSKPVFTIDLAAPTP